MLSICGLGRLFPSISVSLKFGEIITSALTPLNCVQIRQLNRIPRHEYHIRFDPATGRKRPCRDVLDRFKRLNNGLWIRGVAGRQTQRYAMTKVQAEKTLQHVMCSDIEGQVLDKLMTPFWLRPKYYLNDPYKPYHTRRNLTLPRVDWNGKMIRERPKILLDDTTADKYFFDR